MDAGALSSSHALASEFARSGAPQPLGIPGCQVWFLCVVTALHGSPGGVRGTALPRSRGACPVPDPEKRFPLDALPAPTCARAGTAKNVPQRAVEIVFALPENCRLLARSGPKQRTGGLRRVLSSFQCGLEGAVGCTFVTAYAGAVSSGPTPWARTAGYPPGVPSSSVTWERAYFIEVSSRGR